MDSCFEYSNNHTFEALDPQFTATLRSDKTDANRGLQEICKDLCAYSGKNSTILRFYTNSAQLQCYCGDSSWDAHSNITITAVCDYECAASTTCTDVFDVIVHNDGMFKDYTTPSSIIQFDNSASGVDWYILYIILGLVVLFLFMVFCAGVCLGCKCVRSQNAKKSRKAKADENQDIGKEVEVGVSPTAKGKKRSQQQKSSTRGNHASPSRAACATDNTYVENHKYTPLDTQQRKQATAQSRANKPETKTTSASPPQSAVKKPKLDMSSRPKQEIPRDGAKTVNSNKYDDEYLQPTQSQEYYYINESTMA